jgi:predicted lipoprotein with Yx(FWY)xxD motif
MIRSVVTVGGLAVAGVMLAACGSSSSTPIYGSGSSQVGPTTAAGASPASGANAASGAALSLGSSSLGNILVDSQGRTLYLFAADTATTSKCTGACASAWPPATVSSMPTAATGLQASLLATLTRADGTKQMVYNGHPLYTFSHDAKAGDTNGEGVVAFGAGWFVLGASGNKM